MIHFSWAGFSLFTLKTLIGCIHREFYSDSLWARFLFPVQYLHRKFVQIGKNVNSKFVRRIFLFYLFYSLFIKMEERKCFFFWFSRQRPAWTFCGWFRKVFDKNCIRTKIWPSEGVYLIYNFSDTARTHWICNCSDTGGRLNSILFESFFAVFWNYPKKSFLSRNRKKNFIRQLCLADQDSATVKKKFIFHSILAFEAPWTLWDF